MCSLSCPHFVIHSLLTNHPKEDTLGRRVGSKITATEEDLTEDETDLHTLTKEHEKPKASSKVVRRLMKATFHGMCRV